jgi:HEPN domain-containing protein
VRIVAHDIQELNIKLAEGQYFYSDVKKEGCLLYDSGRFELAGKRQLKLEEERRIAQDYFDEWFKSAQSFYDNFTYKIEKNDCKNAAFQLHQAAEASLKTILLVFTHYNPNEHLLGLLCDMAAEHDAALGGVFPTETREEQRRFELLDYAYIGARFDPDYRISKEDLEYLSARVKYLLDRTQKICKAKIEGMTG